MAAAANEAQSFAVHQASQHLGRLSFEIKHAVKSCTADAVHDVRVAIRRFTQAIVIGRTYFPASKVPKNRRLRKIMSGAGEVRNCDIALKLISKYRTENTPQLRSKMQLRREESAALLVAELRKWIEHGMTSKWQAALEDVPVDGENETVCNLARKSLGRIAKDFLKRGEEVSSSAVSPKRLHHFRIIGKTFRYSVELFQPAYAETLNPVAANIKEVSTLLGDINDSVTVADMVSKYKGSKRLSARLRKRQDKKTEEFRQFWKQAFHDGDQLRNSINALNENDTLKETDTLKEAASEPLRKPVASSRSRARRESVA